MTTDLAQLESAPLTLTADTPPDVAAEWLEKLHAVMARARQIKAALEARFIWWIQTTGQEIVIGTRRFYVGHPPNTKCLDYAETLEELFKACGGDFKMVAQCLASDAFKHGECAKVLPPEVYARLFQTTRHDELKEGVAKKPKLLVTDERFNQPRLLGEKQ